MRRRSDVVSASEIASWAWCPESWRQNSLGAEPENTEALQRGEILHGKTAAFEGRSEAAIAVGRWLILAALVLFVLAFFLVSGHRLLLTYQHIYL
jgi:hypothetical protein